MRRLSTSRNDHGTPIEGCPDDALIARRLYRFLFFDWLFVDMTQTRNVFEQRVAWRHNRDMRKHLPTYLRRWLALTFVTFSLGSAFDQAQDISLLAACFFISSCLTLVGVIVISVLWLFLSSPERL